MGLIPYIKTGTSASSDLMNDLYSGLDEAVNLVTNGKSMFFLNGTTTNWSLNTIRIIKMCCRR